MVQHLTSAPVPRMKISTNLSDAMCTLKPTSLTSSGLAACCPGGCVSFLGLYFSNDEPNNKPCPLVPKIIKTICPTQGSLAKPNQHPAFTYYLLCLALFKSPLNPSTRALASFRTLHQALVLGFSLEPSADKCTVPMQPRSIQLAWVQVEHHLEQNPR